jgi:riboflavin kinase/FMN adenylyltransferase
MIADGNIREANRLLGRFFEVSGTVIAGRKRGVGLGFPTANIRMPALAPPRTGVYVIEAEVEGKTYGGAANLGYNPTFGDTDLSLEAHLFNFDQDIYGKQITIRFIDRLRDEKRFSGPQELAAQIAKDVDTAKKVLARSDIVSTVSASSAVSQKIHRRNAEIAEKTFHAKTRRREENPQ